VVAWPHPNTSQGRGHSIGVAMEFKMADAFTCLDDRAMIRETKGCVSQIGSSIHLLLPAIR